ncbi:HNH endonuclease [Neobacillus sp.]|uniref:HNH endonuclease n=1 Tax=Neobacillus sp. TaxID=2675273 RepID=UPI002898C571|nr:HNH endonuclease [Neobacillus sp.]
MEIEKYNKSFTNKEYVKGRGKETEYYIITSKHGNKNYKLTLLRNHSIIMESYYDGLTEAKFGAFEWLISYEPLIFELNKVTMVHYKEDRPNGDPWVKETNIELHKNLKSFFNIQQSITTQKDVAVIQENLQVKDEGKPSNDLNDTELTRKHGNTWIFQGNPNVFDIDNYVMNHRFIWWSLRQEHFLDKIGIDDEVFLWRSDGGQRGSGGILAKARVVSLPEEKTDDENAKDYWNIDDWANPYLAVKLEVLEVRLEEGFINRLSLLEHPLLKDLLILRLRQQTNYLLPPEHAIEIQQLWNSRNSNVQNELELNDMGNLTNTEITETEKEQIIKSRIGQSAFKMSLLAIEKKCRLCGVHDERFLVASHIKPWSQSNSRERLDVNNGLLLCPNHDALFDKGYISFDDGGKVMISDSLEEATKVFLNINETMNIWMNEGQQHYMQWHRNNVLKTN